MIQPVGTEELTASVHFSIGDRSMVVKLCRRVLFAALVLPSANAQAQAQRFHTQSREPTASWYVYAAEDWLQSSDSSIPDIYRTTLEGRAILPCGLEVALRSEGLQSEHGDGMEAGNTTLSAVYAFYDLSAFNFLSVEYGEVVAHAKNSLGSHDRFARFRFQSGPTRAAFEFSVTAIGLTEPEPGDGEERYTTSLGLRSQWGQLYLGTDANITAQDGTGPTTSIDLIAMYRTLSGNSFYGTIEKGVDGGDESEFVSFGFEYRF